ncbi:MULTISPECIES: tetratricopeptide repeat protein [unclassified Paenibacillus]|uniref:tetratricopeptide repeat protein n=1 Tax=unclassified Paenibacillus TaxID=185978 RepID=UPI0030F77456
MRSPVGQPQNMAKMVQLIQNSVEKGRIQFADKIAGQSDIHLLSALVQSLYKAGYAELAKKRIALIDPETLSRPSPPFLELSYIWAEMRYDEGYYREAAAIFEAIAEQSGNLAAARFGAASCYLQEAMLNLRRRMEIYHPPEAERIKIRKYLEDFNQTLHIIQTSGWRTVSSAEQTEPRPARAATLLH